MAGEERREEVHVSYTVHRGTPAKSCCRAQCYAHLQWLGSAGLLALAKGPKGVKGMDDFVYRG